MELTHPFSLLVAGGRKAGKTEFTKNLLRSSDKLISQPIKRIIWCYTKHQPELLKDLLEINKNIEYREGLPDIDNEFDKNISNLIVLDDMMDEASKDERISQLFTRGRHDNVSVIYLTQNLFQKNQRNISLNSDYLVIFKNARDQSQIHHLARQFMPTNSKFLTWAYNDATKEPHSYLMIDVTPTTSDQFRVTTKILPHEAPQIIYIPTKQHL